MELSITKDEIIVIEGNIDDDGFYSAKNFKRQNGLVPSNFMQLLQIETVPMSRF